MAKLTLTDVGNILTSAGTINDNSQKIEEAVENTLSRDGSSPNEMNALLDMNNNRIYNLPAPVSDTEPVRKYELDNYANLIVGPQGYSPVFAIVSDGSRRVQQVVDWIGGEGPKPAVGMYVGATGFVSLIADAVDIRGTIGSIGTVQGRLTLSSSLALTQVDIATATTIYYLPVGGNLVPISNATNISWMSFGNGLSLPLDNNSGHTGWHAANFNYDLFIINDAGVVRLGTGPSWGAGANASPNLTIERATGAGSTELQYFEGFLVNKNTMTVRFGNAAGNTVSVPARCATYVGTVKFTADGTATDTKRQRLLYNAYNQAVRTLQRTENTGSWLWSTSAYRQMNATALNQVEVLFGLDGGVVDLTLKVHVANTTSTPQNVLFGMGVDTIGTVQNFGAAIVALPETSASTRWVMSPGGGFHYFSMMERGAGVVGQDQYWRGGSAIYGQVVL